MPALRKSVELVENDDTIRELVAMVLLRAGYAVRSVTDGAEAVRACLGNVPDLVISDVHMPRMDGFEFVEALRKKKRGYRDSSGHLPGSRRFRRGARGETGRRGVSDQTDPGGQVARGGFKGARAGTEMRRGRSATVARFGGSVLDKNASAHARAFSATANRA